MEGAVDPNDATPEAAALGINGLVLAALEDMVEVAETCGNKNKR